MTGSSSPKRVEISDIIGCWKLERAVESRDGKERLNPTFGEKPTGFLHYLVERRVAVTIPLGERRNMTGNDRRNAPMEELAESARTFDAYAGRFSLIAPDKIAHHIEVSTYQNYVGTDLVRRIALDGDLLKLYVPEFQDGSVRVQRWLEWRRVVAP